MLIKNFDLLEFANSFADISKEILKKKFQNSFDVEKKPDGSYVTNIDKEIELIFREKVEKKYPNHGVIGEEFGDNKNVSEYTWIIDPLDGTHNFISGKPLFGTLISCLKNQKPIIGIVDIPILDERWHGGKEIGVMLNNKKCKNQKFKKDFNELIISSTSLLMFKGNDEKLIRNIYKKIRFPVFGADCYSYGLLLSGKIDLIIEASLKPWDYLAQVSLIEEQGGVITDWTGRDLNLNSDGKIVASLDKNHHKRTIELLNL